MALLHGFKTIFVWSGSSVTRPWKELGLKLAQAFLDKEREKNKLFKTIVEIDAGRESVDFMSHFITWEKRKDFVDPYAKTMEWLVEIGVVGKEVSIDEQKKHGRRDEKLQHGHPLNFSGRFENHPEHKSEDDKVVQKPVDRIFLNNGSATIEHRQKLKALNPGSRDPPVVSIEL